MFLAIAVDNLADADSLTEERAEEKQLLCEDVGVESPERSGDEETMHASVLIKVTVSDGVCLD